jgi:hypothetical protein
MQAPSAPIIVRVVEQNEVMGLATSCWTPSA